MLKKFSFFFIVMFSTLFSEQPKFPKIIDFGNFTLYESYFYDKHDTWTWQVSEAGYGLGLTAFNGAPELGAYFAFLKNTYNLDVVIETGTFQGDTTQFFARCFEEVHTIEIAEDAYKQAKAIFKDQPHVSCHFGSSEQVLREILPSLKDKTVIFYLDAHWNHYWPVFDELDEIGKTHKDNCIIVIDDFKVPGRHEIGFDGYEVDGIYYECSYESIRKHLTKVFTEYTIHYLIPKNIGSRAKFVAIPKKLETRNIQISS